VAINQFQARILFRNLDQSIKARRSAQPLKLVAHVKSDIGEAHPEKLELHLRNLVTTGTIDQFFKDRLADHPDYDMVIEITNPDQISYQTRYVPKVPPKVVKSARKKLDEMFNRRDASKVVFSRKSQADIKPEDWISPMFMKGKGQFDEDGDEAIRSLTFVTAAS
jgi:hypothetical protein